MTTAQQVAHRLSAKGPNSSGWWNAKCPFHEERKGRSLSFTETGYNCNGGSCGAHGHIDKLAEHLGIRERKNYKTMKRDDYKPASSKLSKTDAMNRLKLDRHLRAETIKDFGIQADEKRQAWVYTDPGWPSQTCGQCVRLASVP